MSQTNIAKWRKIAIVFDEIGEREQKRGGETERERERNK